MTVSLKLQCPQCQQDLRIRAEYFNRPIACKHCRYTFTVTGSSPPETPDLAPRALALEQELRQLQASLDAAQAERRTAALQLEQRQEELEQARARLKESEASLEQARQRVEELRSQVQALQHSLEETTAGRDQAQQTLAEQCQRWEAERAALLQEWEGKLHDHRQEAAEQLRRREQQAAEIERLTQESGEQQREHAAVLQRVQELQRSSAEAELCWQGEAARLSDELDALGRRHAGVQQDLAAREQELKAARTAAGPALEQALASARQEFSQEKVRLQAELARAQSQATTLRQALQGLGIEVG